MRKVEVHFMRTGSAVFEVEDETKVSGLKAKVAQDVKVLSSQISLISDGRVLADVEQVPSRGDILAVVLPKPIDPDLKELRSRFAAGKDGADDDEDDFRLPDTASSTVKRIAKYLHSIFKVPEAVIAIIFQVRPRVWLGMLLWTLFARIASELGVGPLYVISTILALIFCNLGTRREGEASAYSIFNNFQNLPGQLTADALDQQVRTGNM